MALQSYMSQSFLCIIPAGAECRTSLKKLLRGCGFGGFVWFGRTIMEFGRGKKRKTKLAAEHCMMKVRSEWFARFSFHTGHEIAQLLSSAEQVQICKNQNICGDYQFQNVMFVACYLIPFDIQWWRPKPGDDRKFFSQLGIFLTEI